jgi:integrase/recombinase XerD
MNTASIIADFVKHRRNLGQRFVHEEGILTAFCRSISNAALKDISPASISRFVNRAGTGARTRANKHSALAGFFRYAVSRQRLKTSPMPQLEVKRSASSFTPHIFSNVELKRMFAAVPAAAGTNTAIDADTLRMFLLLLYGAGLRRGEARRLKVGDVDLHQALLHIEGTKFFKTRIVPLSTGLTTALTAFMAQHHRQSDAKEGPLFSKTDGKPLPDTVVSTAFDRLRIHADIKRDGGPRNQPRLHDLRHSAAVHRVTSWYRSGADVNDLLPKLATFLGHKDLRGTQHYLIMTEELLAEAGRRFEAFACGGQAGGRHD